MNYHQARWDEPLIFELGGKKEGKQFLKEDLGLPKHLIREKLDLPELSEPEVVRHYTRLSQMNYGVDFGLYPLGSCTMKYNPKICEELAALDEVASIHPYQDEESVQGALELMYKLGQFLSEIAGISRVSLQPAAGAHGEFTAMLLTRAYHQFNGEEKRSEVIVPDSAHGTNPASATMAGYETITIPSNERGRVDLKALESALSDHTAALMLTNPNTIGLFENEILDISRRVHEAGGLLFYDGANLNGLLGKSRPGDMGFDIVHFNLHKTFGTPHGGGGPGAGPVGVKKELERFLPVPVVEYDAKRDFYYLDYDRPNSIGKIKSFYGNFGVLVKAYTYILLLGGDGLKEVAEAAVLNANYLMKRLERIKGLELKFNSDTPCKHEVVCSAEPLKRETGITAKDIAKRLLDYGVHAPTCYFPPIVPEALMIEPTESESKRELDQFINAMGEIAEDAYHQPEKLRMAPTATSITRLDEVKAVKQPILSWRMLKRQSRGF
jgi:glycine dehydrogenase subunit 2